MNRKVEKYVIEIDLSDRVDNIETSTAKVYKSDSKHGISELKEVAGMDAEVLYSIFRDLILEYKEIDKNENRIRKGLEYNEE